MKKTNKNIALFLSLSFLVFGASAFAQGTSSGGAGVAAPAPKTVVPMKTQVTAETPLTETKAPILVSDNTYSGDTTSLESKVNILMYVIAGGFILLIITIAVLFGRIRGSSEQGKGSGAF